VKVRYEYFDGLNRTKSNGEIFLSQRTWEQTHSQGTCEYTSGQCDFAVHRQELSRVIPIQRSFLQRRRTAWKISDFFRPGRLALSEKVSLGECSSNGKVFLGGSGDRSIGRSGDHQEHS
jgi:hypothetical protein